MPCQRLILLFSLLFAVGTAYAQDKCKYSEARGLQLALNGVKTVVFEVGQHALRIDATTSDKGTLSGRACASNVGDLPRLTLTQEKHGDKLIVRLQRARQLYVLSFGDHYAYLKISGAIPATLPVQVKVGSGDVAIFGAKSLSADVGSGDVDATHIRGDFFAAVGSGDIEANDVGALRALSIGSGDVSIRGVRGASQIGNIGSGDLDIRDARGDLFIESLGSGDVELQTIGGAIHIGSIGSGNVTMQDIDGDVEVESIGSGELDVRDVHGDLTLRSMGSASVQHEDVTGRIALPAKP